MSASASSSFGSGSHAHSEQRLSRTSFVLDCFRISSSILPRVFPTVLFLTLYASAIAAADLIWHASWTTSYAVTSTLSVVVGLLLVFRNSTSYDRWYEGRKLWQDAQTTARNWALLVWINVDTNTDKVGAKQRAMRLVGAFMLAVKHELRAEYGTQWEDLRAVLPKEWLQSQPANGAYDATAKVSDIERQISVSEASPLLSQGSSGMAHDSPGLPLRILAELHHYLATSRRAGLLDDLGPAGFSLLNTQLLTLSTLFSSMMRISTTPTPLIYAIHLKQSSLIYLLALPLALVGELGWKMVPFTTVVSAMLVGLEGISSEIEDPFGRDKSDHRLDEWCHTLNAEIETIMRSVKQGVQEA
jgi:putative membrane protein